MQLGSLKMQVSFPLIALLRIDVRLQDLETAYFEYGFVRVNKSTILNVYKIRSLKPELR